MVTVLTLRCGVLVATRALRARSTSGREAASEVSTSPATASWLSLRWRNCSCTADSRATGSAMPTGSSANSAETRLYAS